MTAPTLRLKERLVRIAPYFRSSRPGLIAAVAATVVAALTEPMVPALMKQLLDRGFQSQDLPLWTVPIAIVGLFAIRGLAVFASQYALTWATARAVLTLREAMFDRLMRAHPTLFARQSASQLTNTLAYEVQNGTSQLTSSVLALGRDSLTLLALLGYLFYLNWQLTLFVAVLFPAVAWVMRTLSRRLHRLTVASMSATDELAYVVEENTLAWKIVRLHEAARTEKGRFMQAADRMRRLTLKSIVASAAMTPITQILAAVTLSAVIVIALWQSRAQGVSVGGFVAFVTAMLMLIAPIKRLSEVAGPITRGLAALDRAVGLAEDTPVEASGTHDPGRATGRLELRDVSVRYGETAQPALDRLSLRIEPGESVALVGPSGAGKSTLVNLLPRFLDATSGEILLDGRPIADHAADALRRQFALVSQDVVLFNDTVAANVALGDDLAAPGTEARVLEALKAANLLEFVQTLPDGVRTPVGHNGNRLSGGQRQRLAIARAIYKDAPILILDEATSALDTESERLVQQALETLMRGRTSLVIAHRLSTIERADRIVVLDGGRVVEQGSHAELVSRAGLYARLHAMQFGSPDAAPAPPDGPGDVRRAEHATP